MKLKWSKIREHIEPAPHLEKELDEQSKLREVLKRLDRIADNLKETIDEEQKKNAE